MRAGQPDEHGRPLRAGPPSRAAPPTWREITLQRMLTAAGIVGPALVTLSLLVRSSPRAWSDYAVFGAAGVLLPLLRIAPGLSVIARARAVITIVFVASVYAFGRFGFVAGASVSITASSMLAAIYLGRRGGFVLVALSALAVIVIGLLATRGTLGLLPAETDPLRLQNWLRMAATTSLLAALLGSVIDFVIRQVEANARAAAESLAKLRVAYERLAQVHGRLETTKEQERRLIAHELHDELGQTLTSLKLRLELDARAHRRPAAPDPGPELAEALSLVDQLIERVRKMSGNLRPPLLDEVGLVPALRAYLEGQAAASRVGIALEVQPSGAPSVLGPELEIVCFRVVQESVTNALRHSGAQRISVRLDQGPARLSLSISDDGRGFEPATLDDLAPADHLGVVGMRERVRGRAGTFGVRSAPGAGTTIEAELPIDGEGPTTGRWDESVAAAAAERAARSSSLGSWREDVRRGTLAAAAVIAPLLAALALFVGRPRRDGLDILVLVSTGMLLPFLRLARRLPIAGRSATAVVILFLAGTYVLARAGFGTGVSVLLVTSCVLGVVCLRSDLGFLLIGLSAFAHVIVGVLVSGGTLHLNPAEVDPKSMQNWIRMAAAISLLGCLLVMVVDFVIRSVEASADAATDAAVELGRAYERLVQLHGRLDAAKEEERRFIAHELHDELAQTLTALKFRVQMGVAGRAGAPATAPVLGGDGARQAPEALVLIDALISRVRRMSVDLRPPLLDEVGLIPALRAYLEGQASISGVGIQLEAEEPGGATRLTRDLEIGCFRVVQESITNALRHARPRGVRVRVVRQEARLSLSVEDDGRGFDAATTLDMAVADGHLGVLGMRERIRARGGVFELRSRPGGGTTVEVELPITAPPS